VDSGKTSVNTFNDFLLWRNFVNKAKLLDCDIYYNLYLHVQVTDERESPQEAWPAPENSSLGFIEAVHQ